MTDLDPVSVINALDAHPALRPFIGDRVVATMPAKMSRRRVLLNEVALAFEPGVRYSEPEVDAFLRDIFADHATLHRYLVEEGFLDRGSGVYWRTGGSEEAAVWSGPPGFRRARPVARSRR